MKPGTKNIEMVRGDFYELYVRIRAEVWDPLANGGAGGFVPGDYRDLTDWVGKAQVRTTTEDPEVLLEFDIELDDQSDPDTVGGVYVRAGGTGVDTTGLPLTSGKVTHYWDLQMTDDLDRPRTYLAGTVKVIADVTRA